MSRISKILLLLTALIFTLACSLVTQPFNDAQNAVETVQSLATAIPIETLQAFPSAMPMETLQAGFEDYNYFNPQGAPLAEWNGIPIMPQAQAGQEYDSNNYSFSFTGTVQEASDFYGDVLGKVGWSPMVTMPGDESSAVMVYQKEGGILTVTITRVDNTTVVWFSKT